MKHKKLLYVFLSVFLSMFLLSACDPSDTEPQLKVEKGTATKEEKTKENEKFSIKKINDNIKILTDKERNEEYIIYHDRANDEFSMTHREGQKK
ncbi:hypothetical protein [Bacillus sp. NPDC094106]|uniref:hypothetical protein n=1 Tax=Bacillus sp. NPDC094106 TaxID=3363949 RepID=UPI00382830C4